MKILRCILFNICFYGFTAITCFVLLPLLLLPFNGFWIFLRGYFMGVYLIEKYVLGLKMELRGLENLPKDGSFLIACKHQSAYETMKFPIIVNKPAIIMKRELMNIPIWGWIAKKGGMIPIDRGSKDKALKSINDGALKVKNEGRPIVIFPQGTRVAVDESSKKKRYKGGIARMQQATDLPIIPVALNSGLFWNKDSFLKMPGTVVFEFLPPIKAGKTTSEVMSEIEEVLEKHSNILVEEAREKFKYLK